MNSWRSASNITCPTTIYMTNQVLLCVLWIDLRSMSCSDFSSTVNNLLPTKCISVNIIFLWLRFHSFTKDLLTFSCSACSSLLAAVAILLEHSVVSSFNSAPRVNISASSFASVRDVLNAGCERHTWWLRCSAEGAASRYKQVDRFMPYIVDKFWKMLCGYDRS